MALTKVTGDIGFNVIKASGKRETTSKSKSKKVSRTKLITEELDLPEGFKEFNNCEILDIEFAIRKDTKETENIISGVEEDGIQSLKFYKYLAEQKRILDHQVKYVPVSEYAKDVKCPFCKNIGANLMPPKFYSMDEAPKRDYKCLACGQKFT